MLTIQEFFSSKGNNEKIIVNLLDEELNLEQISNKTDLKYDVIVTTLNRLKQKGLVEISKQEGKIKYYKLSSKGSMKLKFEYQEYQDREIIKKTMDIQEQETADRFQLFKKFLEEDYYDVLVENSRKGLKWVEVDFPKLLAFDSDLAEDLLEDPEDTIKALEVAIQGFDIEHKEEFKVRFKNLPNSQKIKISELRTKHTNQLWECEGDVKQKSDPRPKVTSARFECPSCGQIMTVLQLDYKFKEPSKCSCGRKGKFRLIGKKMRDYQGIVIQESLESIDESRQPRRINVVLYDDLVSPLSEKKTNCGNKIKFIGILKEEPIPLKTGGISTKFDFVFEANNLEATEETYSEIEITKRDIEQFNKIKNDPSLLKDFSDSVFYDIYSYNAEKEAIILQQFGGTKQRTATGKITRGNSHILLCGDPATSKSDMLKAIQRATPKSRYAVCTGSSGVGLTGTTPYNDFLKSWTAEGGVIPSANKGIALIDELDKMDKKETDKLHEAMEQEQITISKANVHATLPAETAILASANPKFGRFDIYSEISKQIDLPPPLISRFDLIFVIKDIPEEKKDERIADKIGERYKKTVKDVKLKYTPEFIRKYIAYAKRNFNPTVPDEMLGYLKRYYVTARKGYHSENNPKVIPLTARQFEGLIRLATSSARFRLRDNVTKGDCETAIELLEYSLTQIGFDKESGQIDIDKIETGITSFQRSHITTIKKIIEDLENKIGKTIPIDDVINKAVSQGIAEEKIEEVIERLKKAGDIAEIRRGFIQRI